MTDKTIIKTTDKKIDTPASNRYIEAVGRRKTAIARVRVSENKSSKGSLTINGKTLIEYFPIKRTQVAAQEALSKVKGVNKFNVSVLVRGGGKSAQSEAIRHGIARALVEYDEGLRDRLKKAGFLKRDPRAVERKKFGKKKARKSPQWSKR